jgi:hypothetical protein
MALIKCEECGKEHSTDADRCPSCGAKPENPTRVIQIILLLGFILFLGVMCRSQTETERKATEQAAKTETARRAALTPAERTAEDRIRAAARKIPDARLACQQALMQSLHDPDSAKLESVSTWYVGDQKGGTVLVQPTGRAKNAFGAYINGTWDCVTKQISGNTVVLSLKQIRP